MEIIRNNYLNIIPKNKFEELRIETLLKEKCIYINPNYEKNIKYVKKRFNAAPKYIKTYEKVFENGVTYFKVMKAYKEVHDIVMNMGFKVEEYIDERIDNPIPLRCRTRPRDDEQRKAINSILNNEFGYGVLSAAPSSGKTFISLYCAAKFQQKLLILVDMTLLIEQFVDSILKFMDIEKEEIGFIRGSNKTLTGKEKIVIATIQTLSKDENKKLIEQLSKEIGFIICDEVHIMSCETAQKILRHFKPKHMLGLSGTPERDDKMDFIIAQSIGPVIHTADRQKMVEAGSMLTPILRPLFLKDDELFQKYNVEKDVMFRDVVDVYYNSPKAIDKISNLITHHYYNGDAQLVICKEKDLIERYYIQIIKKLFGDRLEGKAERERDRRIQELLDKIETENQRQFKKSFTKSELKKINSGKIIEEELLKEYLEKFNDKKEKRIMRIEKEMQKISDMPWYKMDCVQKHRHINRIQIFTGSTKKDERERIIKEINNGKIRIVLVTTTFDKALSAERLNILYLLFSTRERANTIQRVG